MLWKKLEKDFILLFLKFLYNFGNISKNTKQERKNYKIILFFRNCK